MQPFCTLRNDALLSVKSTSSDGLQSRPAANNASIRMRSRTRACRSASSTISSRTDRSQAKTLVLPTLALLAAYRMPLAQYCQRYQVLLLRPLGSASRPTFTFRMVVTNSLSVAAMVRATTSGTLRADDCQRNGRIDFLLRN